jgi:hypothetical protein
MKQWIIQLSLKKKILSFFVAFIVGVVLFGLFLYYPLLRNAGSSNGYACSRAHIYLPTRLDFKGCKTVTGTVQRVKVEPDGDTHVRLRLDKQYQGLLTRQNYQKQAGDLVVEDTCQNNPKGLRELFATLTCRNYRSKFPNPTVGKRYEITGNYVIDDWHGSWAELHGLSELRQLN